MTVDLAYIVGLIGPLVTQIEGPYKWYIMGIVAFVLTGLITRFIFKTFKWFIVLLLIFILMAGGFYFVMSLATVR